MKKLLIIVCAPGHGFRTDSKGWRSDQVGNVSYHLNDMEYGTAVLLYQATESWQTTDWLASIIRNFNRYDETMVAAHARQVNWSKIDVSAFSQFSGEDSDPLYSVLKVFCGAPAAINFEKACSKVKEGQPVTDEHQLTVLKHRIAHLFLPIDMDLQGIQVTWRDKGDHETLDYLQESLHGKSSGFYTGKLDELHAMVSGKRFRTNHGKGLNGVQSVARIVESRMKTVRDKWLCVLTLCGLQDDKGEIEPISDSVICKFMSLLDAKAEKKDRIGEDDVKEVVAFFENAGWLVREASPPNISSFHNWVCALDNCLGELRSQITNS